MRRVLFVFFAMIGAATFAAPLFAQEHEKPKSAIQAEHSPAAGEHDAGAPEVHGEHEEKPALLHWDVGSALWSIVVFVILLIILRAAAWKPILQGLQERERFIAESIASAKREREAA